jgi:predicted RNase H-like nuclease
VIITYQVYRFQLHHLSPFHLSITYAHRYQTLLLLVDFTISGPTPYWIVVRCSPSDTDRSMWSSHIWYIVPSYITSLLSIFWSPYAHRYHTLLVLVDFTISGPTTYWIVVRCSPTGTDRSMWLSSIWYIVFGYITSLLSIFQSPYAHRYQTLLVLVDFTISGPATYWIVIRCSPSDTDRSMWSLSIWHIVSGYINSLLSIFRSPSALLYLIV